MLYHTNMRCKVTLSTRARKGAASLPPPAMRKLALLLLYLEERGPVQPKYPNYSRLGADRYHCHLGYHWVACWKVLNERIEMEVYYVGSRESAPY